MDISASVSQIKALNKMFKAVSDVVSVMEEIGNLEKAKTEGETTLKAVRALIESEKQNLEASKQNVVSEQEKATNLVKASRVKAETIVNSAKQFLVDTKEEAKKIVADAKAKSDSIERETEAKVNELETIIAEIGDKSKAHEEISGKIQKTLQALKDVV